VVGANGVGKTTLIRQLLTSEYLANQSGSDQGKSHEKKLFLIRDYYYKDILFIHSLTHSFAHSLLLDETDSCLLVYSVNDRSSFNHASTCLTDVRKRFESNRMFVGLVANKQDLVRNRLISTKEGKKLALKRHCKFLEVSALLDHKVDRLLVSIIRGTR
ncbi:hypothetical protein HELRODRAFT_122480, partial [Helobdella robusta]|uniref:Uncharacterized protein n=1 Tax=Helobdella robusta TaxID=6412 RepID=T1EGU7_HELRO